MENVCIILRGVPGSGKSSHIDTLFDKYGETHTLWSVSADRFFVDFATREYNFDPAKLPQAHAQCLRNFLTAVQTDEVCTNCYAGAPAGLGTPKMLVVDNTNTTQWEMAPYVAIAQAYGFKVEFHHMVCDPYVAFERQTHGVPLDTVLRMHRTLADVAPLPFWGNSVNFDTNGK